MPLMTTRGALSARAFGLFSNQHWVSVTFYANTTWTCPSGVHSVNLSGQGSAGRGDYTTTEHAKFAVAGQSGTHQTNAPYADWATLYAYQTAANAQFSSLPAYGPSSSSLKYANLSLSSDNYYTLVISTGTDYSSKWITYFTVTTINSPSTYGFVQYADISPSESFWHSTIAYIAHGNAGSASTGFSLSFAGGTLTGSYPNSIGHAAPVTNYTAVAVTPTTGYPLVIPSGGSITISYLV